MHNKQKHAQQGWLYAGLIIALLVAFIAIMAWWPAVFAVRLFGTSYFTVGALLGVLMIVVPVAFTVLYARTGRGQGPVDE